MLFRQLRIASSAPWVRAIPFGTTLDEKTSQRIVDMYQEAGGNLIDTSNLYGGGFRGTNTAMTGTSEMTVGKMVAGKREQFVRVLPYR